MSVRFALPVVASLALAACPPPGGNDDVVIPDNAAAAIGDYAAHVEGRYDGALSAAVALDDAIDAFVAAPSAAGLVAAQDAWLASREPYLLTEVFRFYEGPIDNAEDGPEGLMNAWPMDEAFVDYVEGDDDAGLINDAAFEITVENLRAQNENGGEENVATGYHAIEFLLWGQDFDDAGPGVRPFTDYVADGTGTASNQGRRGAYLVAASQALIEDLTTLKAAWQEGGGSYRDAFVGEDEAEGLRRVLTGMIVLSGFETGGERLQAALDSGDQEDEHSCFSDNTHRDMIQDIQGIQDVWLGDGTGISDVIAATDAELADAISAAITESLDRANALQPPFDQEIKADNAAGRARVQALVTALRDQEALLEDAFRLYGLTIPVPE